MDGSGNMPLLVTGKSEKPKCFKHVKFLQILTVISVVHEFLENLTSLERRMTPNAENTVICRPV
jgi:hypothetical protein